MINTIHFIRPWWLLSFVPLVISLLWLWRKPKHNPGRQRANNWQQVVDPHLLPHLLVNANSAKTRLPLLLISIIFSLFIMALAGPAWKKNPQPVFGDDGAMVIVLDLSPAMLAQDIKPDRLRRAKYKIRDVLATDTPGLTGMAVFSAEAFTVSPLTTDTNTIAAMLPELSPYMMPISGSNMGAGLLQGKKLLQQSQRTSGTLLLITASSPTAADQKIAADLRKSGYQIAILGMGTSAGAPIPMAQGGFATIDQPGVLTNPNSAKPSISKLDINGLKALAKAGGGRFHSFTNDNGDIQYLLAGTAAGSHLQPLTHSQASRQHIPLWVDEGHWFILFALPLILLGFRRGWFEEWT